MAGAVVAQLRLGSGRTLLEPRLVAQFPEVRSSVQLPPLSAPMATKQPHLQCIHDASPQLAKDLPTTRPQTDDSAQALSQALAAGAVLLRPSSPFLFHNQLSFSSVSRYEEALNLAQVYNLNTDLVYQKQWAAASVSPESVKVRHLDLTVSYSVY